MAPPSGVSSQQQEQAQQQQEQQGLGPQQAQQEQQEQQGGSLAGAAAPLQLLSLPDTTLTHILGQLGSAGDLARFAAACRAARALVSTHSWPGVESLHALAWAPGVHSGLRQAVERCPSLVELDLSELAGGCGGEELAAVAGLTALRRLSLRGCWRLQGSSPQELALLRKLPNLTSLDLSGSGMLAGGEALLRALPAGLVELKLADMRPGVHQQAFPTLSRIVKLTHLDLGGNLWLGPFHLELLLAAWDAARAAGAAAAAAAALPAAPAALPAAPAAPAAMPPPHPAAAATGFGGAAHAAAGAAAAAAAAAGGGSATSITVPMPPPDRWPSLRRLSLRGCEQLGEGLGELLGRHPGLAAVDLSGTAACDADVEVLADTCHNLSSLNLSGCVRIKGPALLALARCAAAQQGRLRELRLSDLAWTRPQQLAQLLGLLSEWVTGPVSLDLSHCGGLNDTSLLELLPWEQPSPRQAAACPPRQPHTQPPMLPGSPPESWGSSGGQLGHSSSQPAVSWSSSAGGSSDGRGDISSGGSGGQGVAVLVGGRSGREEGALAAAVAAGEAESGAAREAGAGEAVEAEAEAGAAAEADEGGMLVVKELSVAGSSRISASALLQLASWPAEADKIELGSGREGDGLASVAAAAAAGEAAAAGAAVSGPGRHPALLHPVALPAPTGPLLAQLQHLDISHCECFRGGGGGALSGGGAAARSALLRVLCAAGPALRVLRADGCQLGGGLLGALAAACPNLRELSVVGCRGIADADFCALAAGLAGLRKLAVGGAVLSWREENSLTGFTGLTSLRIARRSFLADHQLQPVLSACGGSLKELALASCPALSDASLAALPPGLPHLHLVCCERLTGSPLHHLRRLRSLRLSGCPNITEAAMQQVALSCTRLTLLELPPHVRVACLPVVPPNVPSNLREIKIEGGLMESPRRGGIGRGWRAGA